MEMQTRYTPPTSFRETTVEAVAGFISERVLCTVIAAAPAGLHASHLPVVIARDANGRIFLEGHVARENLAWRLLESEVPAMAIFANQEAYGIDERAAKSMLKDDKPSKLGAVHLHGRLRIIDDEAYISRHIAEMGVSHDAGTYHPWNPAALPDETKARLAGMTIGVIFEIDRAEASFRFPIAALGEGINENGETIDGPSAQRVCLPPAS